MFPLSPQHPTPSWEEGSCWWFDYFLCLHLCNRNYGNLRAFTFNPRPWCFLLPRPPTETGKMEVKNPTYCFRLCGISCLVLWLDVWLTRESSSVTTGSNTCVCSGVPNSPTLWNLGCQKPFEHQLLESSGIFWNISMLRVQHQCACCINAKYRTSGSKGILSLVWTSLTWDQRHSHHALWREMPPSPTLVTSPKSPKPHLWLIALV